jgi:hypothetical protein
MENLDHVLVPLALFGAVVIVIIAILNFILKMRILNSGVKDEYYIRLLANSFEYKSSTLKWGLLLLFGGLGLVVNEFIPTDSFDSPLAYGIEAIFLAGGFLLYYIFARKEKKQ